MRKHLNTYRIGALPAGVDQRMRWGNAERKEFTRAVDRIAPHLLPAGRLERARVAWKKFMEGKYPLRAAILVSRDYAKEFALFRRQGAAATIKTA
jgi:hypothetical protein